MELTGQGYTGEQEQQRRFDSADRFVAADISSTDFTCAYGTITGPCRAIFVGGAGNLVVKNSLGASVTFAVLAGSIYPISTATIVKSSTTATGIIAIF